ncbi:GTP pyrophosphokinase family protein [Paenibacillus sp. IHB B 3415]|uniref:GTP pyrophosphokinase n=1 Tax=Paenibacillus sp. IHB B 3415 TaxID=867080 RepID=UPI00069B4B2F|nr:hypothetical protein [Paenibacillus sp. IHB B 3415]
MELDELYKSYQENRGLYDLFVEELKDQLNVLLDKQKVELSTPITSRVKKWESVVDKCQRYSINPKCIHEINDIAGVRIISVFKRDIPIICSTIQENFNVLRMENVEERLDHTQFGYGSSHFEISLNEDWLKLPSLSRYSGLTVEIQVRTTSQHIWATASHILQYKREAHVPQPLKRSINRTAAILELVDLEFERLLLERSQYNTESIEIIEYEKDTELNLDILRNVLTQSLPEENIEINGEDYGRLLDDLFHFGIRTIKDLESFIPEMMEGVLQEERKAVKAILDGADTHRTIAERVAKGVFYTHCGLIRKMLRLKFDSKEANDYFTNYRKKQKDLKPE